MVEGRAISTKSRRTQSYHKFHKRTGWEISLIWNRCWTIDKWFHWQEIFWKVDFPEFLPHPILMHHWMKPTLLSGERLIQWVSVHKQKGLSKNLLINLSTLLIFHHNSQWRQNHVTKCIHKFMLTLHTQNCEAEWLWDKYGLQFSLWHRQST